MYLFYVYVQKGAEPDMLDDIYGKVISTYKEVAEYVRFLNNKSRNKYYFMRKSAYIDTDSIITTD